MKSNFEKTVRIGFVLVCLLLIGIAVVAYFDVRGAQDAIDWSRHSREVRNQISATLATQQDIEIGVRGYLLTGDTSFLEPYRQAHSKVNDNMSQLKQLTADNPLERERMQELQLEVDRNLAAANALIAIRQHGESTSSEVQQQLMQGKQAMDRIRAIVADMDREEADKLNEKRQAFTTAANKTLWTLGILCAVMFLLFVVSYMILERHLMARRRAEAALQDSEDRVRLVLDSAAEAICGIDKNGLCTFANQATLKTLGYTDGKRLLGHRMHEVAHHTRADGTPYPPAECTIVPVVEQGTPVHCVDEVFWRADGTSFPVEYWSYPMRRDDQITGAVVTFIDITERKRAEQALREANLKLSDEFKRAEQRSKQIGLMSEMAAMLQSCTAPQEAYQIVSQTAGKLFPGIAGALGVISPSRDMVEVFAQWGDPALAGPAFAPADCWALRSGHSHFANVGENPLCKHVATEGCGSTFCVPMMALGESLGIVFISHKSPGCGMGLPENTEQHRLVIAFAESIGLALANLQLRETLRMQSIRDPLTTLYNRRYMEEAFDREIKRATRSGKTIGVIMFDLDHFKRYNDTFGHDAGDVLLKEAAGLVRTLVRGDDIACRFGGEEFLLLMPDASMEVTCKRAEGLRAAVAHLHVEHRGQALGTVTLSAGVAIFPEHGQTPASVVRSADQALYRAKQSGRNRVAVADQVLSS